MDKEDIENLQPVANVHEQTENTAQRVRVLCQLAESLDDDELASLKSDAENAFAFPSLGGMPRAEAETYIEQLEAVEEFREALSELHV
jgi:hypothetical protein